MRRTFKPGNSGEFKRYADFPSLRQRDVEPGAVPAHLPKADADVEAAGREPHSPQTACL
jgi:hypothetical protein